MDESYRYYVEGKIQTLSDSHLSEGQEQARLIYELSLKKEGNSETRDNMDKT